MPDIYLNGVGYDLAEDAEGAHYSLSGEPLRPPNAVTVQGESRQKFQMRPDVLLWTLTDWSGGEGHQKFDPQNPNRWRELTAVRVFQRPGTLQPGWYIEDTQDSTGASDQTTNGMPVVGGKGLHLYDVDNARYYTWQEGTSRWGSANTLTGPTNGAEGTQLASDSERVIWIEENDGSIWESKFSGTPTSPTEVVTDAKAQKTYMVALGHYMYAISIIDGEVREMSKNDGGTEDNVIYDFSAGANGVTDYHRGDNGIEVQGTTLGNKIYFVVRHGDESVVHEVTPTTAAVDGFGKELARFPGFLAWSIWAHGGVLYMGGDFDSDDIDAIMYLQPGGSYGTLGSIRDGDDVNRIIGQTQGGRMLEHYFATSQISDSIQETALWEVDSVSGGYCMVARNEDGDSTGEEVRSVVVYRGDVFIGPKDGGVGPTYRIQRARSDQYAKNSEAISAWHDFDLADEKILSSIVISHEALPADWTITVSYALNGSNSWTTAITQASDGQKSASATISTNSATVKFHTLSIKIEMTYGGAGVPSSGPVVLGVDVRAQVAKPVRVWRLALDLSDSKSRGDGYSGQVKAANLAVASATEGVVQFRDGYGSAKPGTFDDVDVVIDSYQIIRSQPGEGFAQVTLREVA